MERPAMSKPRVLFVVHSHPEVRPGGAEGYALELYHAFRESRAFEPFLVARTGPNGRKDGGVHRGTPFSAVNRDPNQYFVTTRPEDFDFFTLAARDKALHTRHFAQFLREIRPDVVHFHHTLFLGIDLVSIVRRVLPAAAIVYTLHEFVPICHRNGQMLRTKDEENCLEGSPRRCHDCFPEISPQRFFLRDRFIRSHLAHVDLFLAPSRFLRDRYIDWGIEPERIRHEDNGRTLTCVTDRPEEDRPRVRFGFFGQFNPFKGASVALEAMALVSGEEPAAHMWLHGANLEVQPEAFQEEFRPLLEAAGQNVTVHGRYRPRDLPGLMRRIDWVVIPSIWWENSPLVIQEAFAHGRPVLCSDIGGMAEKVRHEIDGLHFRAGDPSSLADTIRRAMRTPGLWEHLHEGIPEVYTMTRHVDALERAYSELSEARMQRQEERP
jgi:glycosyltransferase involved in cell wall biosynthesis